MTVAKIATHVPDAIGRLAQQYRGQANVEALITALASRVQAVEDVLADVASKRRLFGGTAEGAQLDAIGATVGLERGGLDDATYRVLIEGAIGVNYADGSLASILRVTKTIFQASGVWVTEPNTAGHAREAVCAELSLAVADPKTSPELTPRLIKIIQSALAAGVVLVSVTSFAGEQALACEGVQPWVTGLARLDGTGGGKMATVLYQNPLA